MANAEPFNGYVYDPEVVKLGGVLAPPYDVIDDSQREALYGKTMRNVVRVDSGLSYPGDVPGANDKYTRANGHLNAWLTLGILKHMPGSGYCVTVQEFEMPDGSLRRRVGVFAAVIAAPWETSEILPHERTLRGPKEDRMRLLESTATHTSAVFCVWDGAGDIGSILAEITATEPFAGGRTDGEAGSEKHLLWTVTDDATVKRIRDALAPARLYIADGHHRYETAAAYAAAHPGDASSRCLVYISAADDPGLVVLPTHRLVKPRDGMPADAAGLGKVLPDGVDLVDVDTLEEAVKAATLRRATHHAFGVALPSGAALVVRRRDAAASPRDALDVCVLEEVLLRPLGIDETAVREGALAYTRSVASTAAAVAAGEAALGITVNAATVPEVMAVADAGEVMPQKSTYFYPKVPTGIVLLPMQ